MRLVTVVLVGLILWIQASLWFGPSGMSQLLARRAELDRLATANAAARERNERLQAEVSDLREGLEMVEEKARGELGMLRPDELLVLVNRPAPPQAPGAAAATPPAAASPPGAP